jgi:hypothetical protein
MDEGLQLIEQLVDQLGRYFLHQLAAADEQPLSRAVNDWLVGAPQAVTAQIGTYRDMGIQNCMLWFLDYPSLDAMRPFAEKVMPAFMQPGAGAR